MRNQTNGFSIVSAMFILVILTLVGSYIVSVAALTRTSGNLVAQGVRTYYAAKSGLEWATYKVVQSPFNCPAASTTFTVSIANSAVYSVTVTCTQNSFQENNITYNVFQLTSTGSYGTLGSLDYASRQVYATIIQPGM